MPVFPSSRAGRTALALAFFGAATLGLCALAGRARLARADFAFTSGGEVRSLDPHAVTGIPEGRIIRTLFEGLVVRHPMSLVPSPGVAHAWDIDSEGLIYTFHLREGARWSNDDPVTAHDFEWSFRRLLEPETAAEYASQLWCVAGAREFTTGRDASGAELTRDWSRVGIRALDERTLEIRLSSPAPIFLDVLTMPALSPVHRRSLEATRAQFPDTWQVQWTKPERLVTNGPFRLLERRLNDRMRFVKNTSYWDADHVALRTIDALAIESWTSALNLYSTGELDWVDGAIPTSLVPRLLGREDFKPAPYLGIYFYRINTTKAPLDDVRVRQALAAAVGRREICDKLLKAGQKPATTFVPWGAVGHYKSPPGMNESLGAARAILGRMGLWNAEEGASLPALEIHYNSSEVHRDIAEVIAAQWQVGLGLDVRLRNQEWKAFLDAQAALDYDISRSSWIADYVDPSSFLEIWVSGGENNRTGWSNAGFDELIERARVDRDPARRTELYQRAEQILLNEAPIIPIYSYVSQNLLDPRVGGFFANELNQPSPKHWYWMDDEDLAQVRAAPGRRGQRVESHGPPDGLYAPAATREERAK